MGGILQVDTIQNNNATTLITQTNSTTLTFGVSGQNIVIPSGVTFNTVSATVTLPSTINATTINVTTVVLAAGAVGTPSLTTSGDTNTGIFFPSADTIAFTEGGTEAMRILSNGDVAIGITSSSTRFHVGAVSNTGIMVSSTDGTTFKGIAFNTSDAQFTVGTITNHPLAFFTNNAERMRIDSDGSVRIGGTGLFNVNEKLTLYGTSTPNNPTIISDKQAAGSAGSNHILFHNSNSYVGSITTSGSATAYNTSSDYRLKKNVNYNFDATTRLKQLKPARFNFITDANKTVDGFLAHEVQDIIPEAITGTKDETLIKEKVVINSNGGVIAQNIEQADWEAGKIPNEEGTSQYPIDSTWEASKVVPVYQGIDQAKLTPILTKALQEAIAKIEQLEERLTALESN